MAAAIVAIRRSCPAGHATPIGTGGSAFGQVGYGGLLRTERSHGFTR
jgi:hypothetical protein